MKVTDIIGDISNEEKSLIEDLKNSENFKIIKIGAEWCPPCVRLKPYFTKSKEENKNIDFYDIDLGSRDNSRNENIARYFKVYGIPYVVLLSKDNEILRKAQDNFHFMDEFKDLIKD